MRIRRINLFLIAVGVAVMGIACTAPQAAADPTDATSEAEPTITELNEATATTMVEPTDEDVVVYEADPDNLQPCGAFETMRFMETPVPVTAAPVTPAPTPTPDTRPAPAEDHIGFPENYQEDFKLFFVFDRPDRRLVRAICGNDIAATRKEGEPYPYGSVLLMVSYAAKLGDNSQPILDEDGHYIRAKMTTLHMMRKEEGYGEAYGENRTGEWEYVGYFADGSYETRPENSAVCASCHLGDGGESVDYVFRMDMLYHGDEAAAGPSVNENEVSIYLYSFHASQVEIKAGTTITWINNDEASHTVMAAVRDDKGTIIPDPNMLFASSVLPSTTIQPGSSFSFTFEEPGEYLYICTKHKNMVGKIIVTE